MKRHSFIPLVTGVFILVPALAAQDLSPSQVFEKVKASVVVVKAFNASGNPIAQGSGIKLPSGRFITNFHVVKEGTTFRVGHGDHFVPATIYAADAEKDLCLLDAPGLKAPAIVLGHAANLRVGATVYAVGSPQGLELSLSNGLVSQLRGGPPPIIQTTAAISPGSSGGGLFDAHGRLVGITSFYLKGGQNLNFAIPVEWIKQIKITTNTVNSQEDRLSRSIVLEAQENWPALLALGEEWTSIAPSNYSAWTALAEADAGLNLYHQSCKAYLQATMINPNDYTIWYNLGLNYFKLNEYTKSIEAFQRSIRINPNHGKSWNNMGLAYFNLQMFTDAIDAYRQALKNDINDDKIWFNLGLAYYSSKRPTDAIEAYRQSLKLNPNCVQAWNNLVIAYYVIGDNSSALGAVQQLRKLDPAQADNLFNVIVPK